MRKNGDQGMKSLKDIQYLLLVTVAGVIVFGFFAFLGLRHTDIWWEFTLLGAPGGFAYGVYSLRSRGLGYSATIRESHTAAMQDYAGGRPRPALAEFNRANARLLSTSLFLYLVVVILVWTAASYIIASPTLAFVLTIATFIVAHIIRIMQLKELPDISFGFAEYARTAFGSLVAACAGGGAFWYTLTKAGFSWKTFWLVGLCLVLISCMSMHADFAIAKLIRRSSDK
jgi:hypothetical protein